MSSLLLESKRGKTAVVVDDVEEAFPEVPSPTSSTARRRGRSRSRRKGRIRLTTEQENYRAENPKAAVVTQEANAVWSWSRKVKDAKDTTSEGGGSKRERKRPPTLGTVHGSSDSRVKGLAVAGASSSSSGSSDSTSSSSSFDSSAETDSSSMGREEEDSDTEYGGNGSKPRTTRSAAPSSHPLSPTRVMAGGESPAMKMAYAAGQSPSHHDDTPSSQSNQSPDSSSGGASVASPAQQQIVPVSNAGRKKPPPVDVQSNGGASSDEESEDEDSKKTGSKKGSRRYPWRQRSPLSPEILKLMVRKRNYIQSAELKQDTLIARVAQHPWFESCALFLICLNTIWIGVDLEARPAQPPGTAYQLDDPFNMVEQIFCIGFTIEIWARYCEYKKTKYFFTDPPMWRWNLLDLLLVILMQLENWVFSWAMSGDAGVKSLSAFRTLRLLRISRIFRMVPEFAMMIKSMGAAARSVTSTLVLAIGIIYCFGIVFTQWGRDIPEMEDEFGNLFNTSLSLVQIMVYDKAFMLIRYVLRFSLFYGILLLFVMILGGLTVLNMLIGVICEIVTTTKREEEMKILAKKLEKIFLEIDENADGLVQWEEFDSMRERVKQIGIDPDVCALAFELLDASDNVGEVPLADFKHMVSALQKPPQTQDLLVMKKNVELICRTLGVGEYSIETDATGVSLHTGKDPFSGIGTMAGMGPRGVFGKTGTVAGMNGAEAEAEWLEKESNGSNPSSRKGGMSDPNAMRRVQEKKGPRDTESGGGKETATAPPQNQLAVVGAAGPPPHDPLRVPDVWLHPGLPGELARMFQETIRGELSDCAQRLDALEQKLYR